jgi:hypothetical protein
VKIEFVIYNNVYDCYKHTTDLATNGVVITGVIKSVQINKEKLIFTKKDKDNNNKESNRHDDDDDEEEDQLEQNKKNNGIRNNIRSYTSASNICSVLL